MNNKILVIAGPTAVGKTSLSISIAKQIGGEIVSADSMQVYKGLNIGTAKPTKEDMDGVKHHMLDVCHPSQRFSVAQYVTLASQCIEDILSRGKTPIIVGGTGLYIDNLIYSNDFGELAIDIGIRTKLMREAEIDGSSALLERLFKIDSEYAEKLHPNDVKRIVHALEIYYSTGKTQSQIIAESRVKPPRFSYLYAVLDFSERALLYERINKRVDLMLEEGLLDEAQTVISSDWYVGSTASQAIGYKEFELYFRGEASLQDCTELLKQRSRNYAKRQLTWFRHKNEAKFYLVDKNDTVSVDILNDFAKV